MNKKRVFLIVQSILCVVLTGMLAAAAIGIYRDGLAVQAADSLSGIYTRAKVAESLRPILPLLILGFVLTAIGLVVGIRDENRDRPAKDKECLRDLAADRVAAASAERKKDPKSPGRLRLLRSALLLLALALIVAGVFNGSARDVFGKAVKICTECVGLG